MDGIMTDHEISPASEPGVSTLTVKGEDLSAVMKYLCLTGIPYPAMPEYVRVNLILLKYLALGITPLVIPQIFGDIPIPTERIPTHKCTDHAYLTELATKAGYVFYVDPGPLPGMSTRYGRVLKARGLVGVRGAGLAFDGFHFVRSVTSTLQRGSFTQSFELVRNALISNTPRVFSIAV